MAYLSQDIHSLRLPEENLWLIISGVIFSHPDVFSQLFSSLSPRVSLKTQLDTSVTFLPDG